jgi:hypothetical protein
MKFLVTLIFCFLAVSISAQYTRTNYYEIYAGPGLLTVFSDIGDYNTGFALNTGFRYRFSLHFAFRANLVSGLITGTDEGSRNENRGINFNTVLIEPTAQLEYFIFREKRGFNRRGHLVLKPFFNPYLFAGAGGIYFYPSIKSSNVDLISEDYSKFAPVINGGGGFNFIVSKKWSLGMEIGGRFITTDFLDGYTSTASKSNDLYYYTAVNIIYRFIPVPLKKR